MAGVAIGHELAEPSGADTPAVFIDSGGHPSEVAHALHCIVTEAGGVRLN